jgi:hypothetical protein
MFPTILPGRQCSLVSEQTSTLHVKNGNSPGKNMFTKPNIVWVTALVICLFAAAAPVLAESPFALEPKKEWLLLGTGAALGITGLALWSQVEPLTLDEINALDINDVNSFDRGELFFCGPCLSGIFSKPDIEGPDLDRRSALPGAHGIFEAGFGASLAHRRNDWICCWRADRLPRPPVAPDRQGQGSFPPAGFFIRRYRSRHSRCL